MDINIIASSSTELNNKYIFSLLKNRDKSKNHIIIAPDRSQFSIEQRLFEETGEKCFFDINVISLTRLAKSILKGNNKKVLTKQSGVALVRKILNDNKDKLFAFSKATSFVGFASSLFETICFYKSCNVKPSEVYVDDSNSITNLKQKDIKLVYTAYEEYLQNDFTDSFNQLQLFADSINKDTFKDTIFYLIEFDDYTKLMYNIILKLSKFSDGMFVSCSYGKENLNSNIFNNKVYYDLIDLYKSENLEYKINKLNGFENQCKEHLRDNLFAYSPKKFDLLNSGINIRELDTINDEIKYTISDIYSKLLNEECSLSDFAIVVPNLNDYKSSIVSELDNYSLNYYFDESSKLSDNYLVRLIFEICNIIIGDYRLPQFSNVIKSPLLNFDSIAVADYDNYLRRIGAISDMCLRYSKTENEDIIGFIKFINEVRDQVKVIETFLDATHVITQIYDYVIGRIESFVSTLSSLEHRTFNQVTVKFENINKDVISVFADVKVESFADFLEIYKEYFDSTNISLPPITSNTLFIADFGASYISKQKYIYILGNNDGKLPSQKLDNGLLTDDELSKMPNAKKLTPTIAMLNARKVLKLYDIVFKFEKELVLSYSNSSLEGTLYPNKLISSLVDIGDIEIINYSSCLDVINNNYNEVNNEITLLSNLTLHKIENNLIDYLSNWNMYNHNINYRSLCSTLYNLSSEKVRALTSNMNSYKPIPLLSKNDFLRTSSSVSQIESFNRCPYIHFVRYGLRLKDNNDSRLKPNDIGTIIHDALSKVVPMMLKLNDLDLIKDNAKNNLSELLQKEEYKEIVENQNNSYVIKALYRELERVVIAVYNQISSSNYKPKYFEYYFDKSLTINGVNFRGFVDRIDMIDDEFVIIDYKTGDNEFKNYNDIYSGKKLQLLLYARAFQNVSGKVPNGAFYLPISNAFGEDDMYRMKGVLLKTESNIVNMDNGLTLDSYKSNTINLQTTSKGKIRDSSYYKNMCLSREDFDYLLDFAIKQVERAVDRIRLGEINPYPLTDSSKCVCDYCDYKALCNYNNDNPHQVVSVENIEKLKELEDGGISTESTAR